ncbi:hypothetical protein [Paenibacillus sp. FSL H3-0333]|uniref:hypothetical protein n=1 Tax=Paenibacillus sp. FSL H3-0333 TaxID=2921373 RepID=UPI0030FC7AE8
MSNAITIPLNVDGAISKISWNQSVSGDARITVQTRTSYDQINWTEWRNCINGGNIPDINESTFMYNLKVVLRIIIESSNYSNPPSIQNDFTLTFEPVMVFENKGNRNCEPEIWITKLGNGDFSIINTSHNNETFKFTNLVDQETVYVNNENQDIQSSNPIIYRYSDFNDNYLKFPVGKNVLKISGNAKIKFRYQFKRIQ